MGDKTIKTTRRNLSWSEEISNHPDQNSENCLWTEESDHEARLVTSQRQGSKAPSTLSKPSSDTPVLELLSGGKVDFWLRSTNGSLETLKSLVTRAGLSLKEKEGLFFLEKLERAQVNLDTLDDRVEGWRWRVNSSSHQLIRLNKTISQPSADQKCHHLKIITQNVTNKTAVSNATKLQWDWFSSKCFLSESFNL